MSDRKSAILTLTRVSDPDNSEGSYHVVLPMVAGVHITCYQAIGGEAWLNIICIGGAQINIEFRGSKCEETARAAEKLLLNALHDWHSVSCL